MLAAPGDSFLQHALGLEFVKLGDDDTAKGYFESLLSQNPSYVGSYYHLGKLWERKGHRDNAIQVYEAGMKQARLANDNHAYNELQAAHEDLMDY